MDTKDRLRRLMNERGWSVYRIAKEAGLPWSTVHNMFIRNTEPSIKTLECLCRGMGMTLPQFFDADNEMGLSPEQAQLLQKWNGLCEKDKQLIAKLIESLSEKR